MLTQVNSEFKLWELYGIFPIFNCGWFELGIMGRTIMPIMAHVCLRLGASWSASQNQFVVVSFNLQTHQESGLFFCCLLVFSLLVS
jgi:hypothetical protein